MQKRNASLISIVLLSAFSVLSFCPVVFKILYWHNDTAGVGIATLKSTTIENMFYGTSTKMLAGIVVAFAILGTVVMIMQYMNSGAKWVKIGTYAPLIAAILYAVLSVMKINSTFPHGDPSGTATKGYYGYWETKAAWGFYLEWALIIASAVISFLIAKGKLVNNEKKIEIINSVPSSNADELKKYKELLDSGAITQQEYDKKKNELLGL